MTIPLRDHFAVAALPIVAEQWADDAENDYATMAEDVTRNAYILADAMLRARGEAAPETCPRVTKEQLEKAAAEMARQDDGRDWNSREDRAHYRKLARLVLCAAGVEVLP